jgi:two-component system, NarL family, sensor kinase
MKYGENEVNLLLILANVFFLLTIIVVGKLVYTLSKNTNVHDLQIRELALAHEKDLMQARLEIQEQTLQDIARELHDNINYKLFLSRMRLLTLKNTAGIEMKEDIDASIGLVEEAIEDVSVLSHLLNTEWVRRQGLIHALETEMEKLNNTRQFVFETHISYDRVVLMDAEKELLIFRIVQEVFNNIIKHTGAKKISFSLQYHPDHLCLTITDDGKGFDYSEAVNQTRGSGLSNLELRAKVLEAPLTIDASPGKGTTVSFKIPYQSYTIPQKNKKL